MRPPPDRRSNPPFPIAWQRPTSNFTSSQFPHPHPHPRPYPYPLKSWAAGRSSACCTRFVFFGNWNCIFKQAIPTASASVWPLLLVLPASGYVGVSSLWQEAEIKRVFVTGPFLSTWLRYAVASIIIIVPAPKEIPIGITLAAKKLSICINLNFYFVLKWRTSILRLS